MHLQRMQAFVSIYVHICFALIGILQDLHKAWGLPARFVVHFFASRYNHILYTM